MYVAVHHAWRFGIVCLIAAPAVGGEVFVIDDDTVEVDSFMIQLNGLPGDEGGLRPRPIARAPHELVVMDYARHGDHESRFSAEQIDRVKHSWEGWDAPGHRKVTLAYIDVAEASDHRFYWDESWTDDGTVDGILTADAPNWLGPINFDRPNARRARFWRNNWKRVLRNDDGTGWIDFVLEQDFDGACLDCVDAYKYWSADAGELTELEAAQRMIDLVIDLADHARAVEPTFLIMVRNAPLLLDVVRDDDPDRYAAFVEATNAFMMDDLYFYGNKDLNNSFNTLDDERDAILRDYRDNDRPVFVVEYLTKNGKLKKFRTAAEMDCVFSYAAMSRDLDEIYDPGTAPNCVDLSDIDADLNDDGVVNVKDLLILNSNFGACPEPCPGYCLGDLNEDCLVNAKDLVLLIKIWH